jgi:hypothetical protein
MRLKILTRGPRIGAVFRKDFRASRPIKLSETVDLTSGLAEILADQL